MVDRVETNRIERNRKLIKVTSILLLLLGVLKVSFAKDRYNFSGLGFWPDTVGLYFIFPIWGLTIFRKQTRNNTGQFIEWWTDKIVYKAKQDEKIKTIFNTDISDYKIGVDLIEILFNNKSNVIINIEDFTDFNIRLKIKRNLEKLAELKSSLPPRPEAL